MHATQYCRLEADCHSGASCSKGAIRAKPGLNFNLLFWFGYFSRLFQNFVNKNLHGCTAGLWEKVFIIFHINIPGVRKTVVKFPLTWAKLTAFWTTSPSSNSLYSGVKYKNVLAQFTVFKIQFITTQDERQNPALFGGSVRTIYSSFQKKREWFRLMELRNLIKINT